MNKFFLLCAIVCNLKSSLVYHIVEKKCGTKKYEKDPLTLSLTNVVEIIALNELENSLKILLTLGICNEK
jgi:hypothetical protein